MKRPVKVPRIVISVWVGFDLPSPPVTHRPLCPPFARRGHHVTCCWAPTRTRPRFHSASVHTLGNMLSSSPSSVRLSRIPSLSLHLSGHERRDRSIILVRSLSYGDLPPRRRLVEASPQTRLAMPAMTSFKTFSEVLGTYAQPPHPSRPLPVTHVDESTLAYLPHLALPFYPHPSAHPSSAVHSPRFRHHFQGGKAAASMQLYAGTSPAGTAWRH